MALFGLYYPKEIILEGSRYENVPGDNGGGTKFGLTLDDVHEYNLDLNKDGKVDINDVKDMIPVQAYTILKKLYWDFFFADKIRDQLLAEFIVDGGLNMGRVLIAKYLQSSLGIRVDGKPGNITLDAINAADPKKLFTALYAQRNDRYAAIIRNNPSQQKFANGWKNRLNAIKLA